MGLRMAVEPLFLNPRGGAADGYVVAVDHSPFTIGRRPDNDLELAEAAVSGRHAELRYEAGVWLVVDLESRNGTFLNGQRVEHQSRMSLGDILHVARRGFQVVPGQPSEDGSMDSTILAESASDVRGVVELLNIIEERRTYPHFQPIIDLASEKTIGFEALGRAATSAGSVDLAKLFRWADKTNVETSLSTRFRESACACAGCRHCWSCETNSLLFLNVHPTEILDPNFMQTLEALGRSELRKWYRLVVELPETWVSNTEQIRGLSERIHEFGILVAYDDFGVGQSRLSDLITVPPDFLKLDRQLVSGLDSNQVKQDLVRALVSACHELHVTALAEGIETPEEREACHAMHIELGQGFLLGRPQPVFELFEVDVRTLVDDCPFVRLNLVQR